MNGSKNLLETLHRKSVKKVEKHRKCFIFDRKFSLKSLMRTSTKQKIMKCRDKDEDNVSVIPTLLRPPCKGLLKSDNSKSITMLKNITHISNPDNTLDSTKGFPQGKILLSGKRESKNNHTYSAHKHLNDKQHCNAPPESIGTNLFIYYKKDGNKSKLIISR